MRLSLIRPIALSALFMAPLGLGAQEIGLPIGTQAPGAAVETLDGKPIDLAQYLGKGPVLLEFWATWCPNCKALEPRIEAALQKYAGKLTFVAVAVSVNQTPERIKAYLERYKMTHDVVYDRRGYAADAYEAPATSYIVAINAEGKVVYTGVGSDQDIDAAVRKAM